MPDCECVKCWPEGQFNEIAYMQWHENGYITIIIDEESTYVSSEPITSNWRGYNGDKA